MSRAIRSMTLALTLLVLCSSATYALPSTGRLAPEDLFTTLWDRLVAWISPDLPARQEVVGSWTEKEGSQMDPNGIPIHDFNPQGSMSDAGSQMDPDGYK